MERSRAFRELSRCAFRTELGSRPSRRVGAFHKIDEVIATNDPSQCLEDKLRSEFSYYHPSSWRHVRWQPPNGSLKPQHQRTTTWSLLAISNRPPENAT